MLKVLRVNLELTVSREPPETREQLGLLATLVAQASLDLLVIEENAEAQDQ